ncbi:MAG TPA: amidase [Hyphomicrobiales bacterium]|nr:amidase [Hyphomicrobiales bacterium]
MTIPADSIGALCTANAAKIEGSGRGPLAGLTFVAKDVFNIAGFGTSFGHPEWLATHPVAGATAPAVQRLLDAGAGLIGKAHSDELCYSLSGENVHYGTPINVAALGRVPGGSSSGSAAAVAAKLCDFALGTDCGGSVRIPASYCGIIGIRPSFGRVPRDGVLEFAPSFDVVGWFARDGKLMRKISSVLLPRPRNRIELSKLLIATDAFAEAPQEVQDALTPAVKQVASAFAETGTVTVAPEGLAAWFEIFRAMQAFEVWRSLGTWIRNVNPKLGPGVGERLKWAATVTPAMYKKASKARAEVKKRLMELLPPGTALCLPASPGVAPLRGMPQDRIEVEYRNQAMRILCIAGLGGLPQISLPLANLNGLPLGVSVVGWKGADAELLRLAESLCPSRTNPHFSPRS